MLTPHFAIIEMACRDGSCLPDDLIPNARHLCLQLEALRTALGRPIVITSGYRTPAHNARVRGAANSQHVLGRAADIAVAGIKPAAVAQTIERLIGERIMAQGGLGLYPRWVHYDTRGTRARWAGP